MNIKPSLVQIETKDGLTLPGLLYETPKTRKVVIHLHGNGSSSIFYQYDQINGFIKELEDNGYSFLMFNNRGAHYIKKLKVKVSGNKVERKRFGMAYEKIKECVYDIDAAISFLEKSGYKEFYLIGHSTGANKIVVYNYYKPKNKVSGYILVGGGDDTGLYYDELGKDKFIKLLKEAKNKIKLGKGGDIICDMLPNNFFSYQGFYDIANPDGDYNTFPFLEAMGRATLSTKPLFRFYKSIKKPTLVVYGGQDEYQYGDVPKVVSILEKQQPKFSYEIVKDADHGFSGKDKKLGKLVVTWLNKLASH